MNRRVLIDTSMWTCAIRRKGHDAERAQVNAVVIKGVAAWCDPVRLELWQGVSGDAEREMMAGLEKDIDLLPTTPEMWDLSCRLADRGRRKGLQFPYADLLIFACSVLSDVDLLHRDAHFTALADLHKQGR